MNATETIGMTGNVCPGRLPRCIHIGFTLVMAVFLTGQTRAHHADSAYDEGRVLSASGTVKEFLWANPHVRVYLEVKDDKGRTDVDIFECGSVNIMMRSGWAGKSIKVNDKLVITYHPRRDARPGGMLLTATDALGKTLGWRTVSTP